MAFDFLKKKEGEGEANASLSQEVQPADVSEESETELTFEQQCAKELTDCLAGELLSDISLSHPYWKLRDELHMKLHKAKENK